MGTALLIVNLTAQNALKLHPQPILLHSIHILQTNLNQ